MERSSIARNSIYLYVQLFFSLIISLYSSRILLSTLGVEDFGIYNVVSGVVIMLIFFRNSLVDATQRFLTMEIGNGNQTKLLSVFRMSINVHFLLSIILILIFCTLGLWFVDTKLIYPEFKRNSVLCVYITSVFNFILAVMIAPYMAIIVAYERMKVYALIHILTAILKLIIILIVDNFPTDIEKLIEYSVLLSVVTVIEVLVSYEYIRKEFPAITYKRYWNTSLFNQIIGFSGWNTMSSCAILFVSQGANILLNLFFGPIANAANGIAYQVMGAVRQFSSSFQSAINPRIVKLYAKRNNEEMLQLCSLGARFSFYLLSFFLFFVFYNLFLLLLFACQKGRRPAATGDGLSGQLLTLCLRDRVAPTFFVNGFVL